jgi:integrase
VGLTGRLPTCRPQEVSRIDEGRSPLGRRLLGTGLRFGELAGLRRRRVHLNRPVPVLEVGSTRYQAGRPGHAGSPTARRVLQVLRDAGPQRVDQLAARLRTTGRRLVRPATIAGALEELHAAGLATVDGDDQDVTAGRWSAVPAARDPLLEAVDLHGAHDLRHTYATRLEDAGIPARVADELMGHEATGWPKAVAKITDDLDVLLELYNDPVEH